MTRHKHRKVIKAWAEGAEVQVRHDAGEIWVDLLTDSPCFYLGSEYRIKPRTLKREGWVNIYRAPGGTDMRHAYGVHDTEEAADIFADHNCVVATVKIEWEEEE